MKISVFQIFLNPNPLDLMDNKAKLSGWSSHVKKKDNGPEGIVL